MTAPKVQIRDEVADLFRRGIDIVVFAEEILGLRLNGAQRRWLTYAAAIDEKRQWIHHRVIHVAANQIGKTLGVAILILWAMWNKIGVPPATSEQDALRRWAPKPYRWFHLAPTQQQAYLCLTEVRGLISGSHRAQVDGSKLPEGLFTEQTIANYDGLLCRVGGATCQFRTTDDKAQALQGVVADGISFDEAAFEDHLTSVINETLEMRLISTGGPLLLVSTPNGMNDYFDIVDGICPGAVPPSSMVAIRDDSVVTWSFVQDNVGYGLTQSRVDAMEQSLDVATKEQQLRGAFLNPQEAFFVPSDLVLDCFRSTYQDLSGKRRSLPTEQPPEPGHRYIIFWDPSLSSDPTAVVVLDVTDTPWVGVYFRHTPPMGITSLINEMMKLHLLYNSAEDDRRVLPRSRAATGYDATAMGGVAIGQLLRGIRPQFGLDFGGPDSKIRYLTNARAALTGRPHDQRMVVVPDSWLRLRQETVNYRLKDAKIQQDALMAFVGALELASRGGIGTQTRRIDAHARTTTERRWG